VLALTKVPHPSTLWHVEQKLLEKEGSTPSWLGAVTGPGTAARSPSRRHRGLRLDRVRDPPRVGLLPLADVGDHVEQ
jgi:hypothetical protein